MARISWKLKVGLTLTISFLVMVLFHILIFRDAHTLFFYLALDLVFVPIQVLLVTILIEHLMTEREKQAMMRKLNMVIGAFFSEVGSVLMRQMGEACIDFPELEKRLSIRGRWGSDEYRAARQFMGSYECRFNSHPTHMGQLRDFLVAKRSFVLGLLQNPNLLEHEDFTDLLWAICHLTEELEVRQDLGSLPVSDLNHLEGDTQRAFGILVREWLDYMQHLKVNYPYIYSLALRMNPFNPNASPIVTPS